MKERITRGVKLEFRLDACDPNELTKVFSIAQAASQPTRAQLDAGNAAKLLSNIKIVESTGCWEWQGGRDKPPLKPYGNLYTGGSECVIKAHRFSFALFKGEIPKGVLVLHKCDNPPCCNPAHLFLGSHKENTQDMFNKGRQHVRAGVKRPDMAGTNSRNAKLNDESVRKMRSMYVPHVFGCHRIAKLFGVTKATAMKAIRGESWSHV